MVIFYNFCEMGYNFCNSEHFQRKVDFYGTNRLEGSKHGYQNTRRYSKMKVLGICAGRINGNTEIMMKEAFKAIEAKIDGVECKLVRLQEAEISKCTGCEACMMNHLKGNFDFRCITPQDADHYYFIEQLMREADAIIVSSPAYNLMPTGPFINFLNKLHASGNDRE